MVELHPMGEHFPVLQPVGIRTDGGRLYRVRGSSMEPALRAADLLLADACDVAGLRPGDLVVMSSSRQGGSCAAPIVHRLVEARRGEDGLHLRTRGDNRMTDDRIWTEDEVVGRVARAWRQSSAGYRSLAIDARANRWHAALARAEGQAWAVMRAAKWRFLGARSLVAAPLFARLLHGFVRAGHGLVRATVTGGAPDGRGLS
jgi:signal peptidase I